MPFQLADVVPWGRSFDEYRCMFGLSDDDLDGRILGCADGPASFNAEASRLGCDVVSCDPLYRSSARAIEERIRATFDVVIEQTRRNEGQFVWRAFRSVEELAAARLLAMKQFLTDFATDSGAGRYLAAQLPALPFIDGAFALAVCSHFLFLYSQQLGVSFHCRAALELSRVAEEVRVFPLLTLAGQRSQHVETVAGALQAAGRRVSIEVVDYEFQRGGNEMMRITAA